MKFQMLTFMNAKAETHFSLSKKQADLSNRLYYAYC